MKPSANILWISTGLLSILSTNLTSCLLVISFAIRAFCNAIPRLLSRPGNKLLKQVAADEVALISTGASDWMESNGAAKRADGSFRVSAKKTVRQRFAKERGLDDR
jgi:hypothetical protein